MTTTAKIINYDGSLLVISPDEKLDRDIMQKQAERIEIRLIDGREITALQRRKIFALIRDIALWSGHDPEYLRELLTWEFVKRIEGNYFSLSNVDRSTARDFISYLIDFCFTWDIPTKDTLLNQTDDLERYLYLCLEHRKCAVCNGHADVHHVDRIGMGFDREKVVHVGLLAVALCRGHHETAHCNEKEFFAEKHIFGIRLDEYLCKRLRLNTKGRRRT
jgi:hypothetical protein